MHLSSDATIAREGRPQGVRLPTVCPGKGTHKGCPYLLSSLGVMPWEGHPQGVPLQTLCPGKGAHKGCPYRLSSIGGTDCLLSAVCPGKGTHKGCPYRRYALGRAPTRGAPTDCLLSAVCPGKGTHKGCPYRRYALGRVPTRGAPTDSGSLTWVCPNLMQMPWGGGSPAYAGIDLCGVPVACLNWGRAENRRKRRIRGFRSGLGLVA